MFHNKGLDRVTLPWKPSGRRIIASKNSKLRLRARTDNISATVQTMNIHESMHEWMHTRAYKHTPHWLLFIKEYCHNVKDWRDFIQYHERFQSLYLANKKEKVFQNAYIFKNAFIHVCENYSTDAVDILQRKASLLLLLLLHNLTSKIK